MRDAAAKGFTQITVAFEGGYINWMFPDVKGLVSTGFGLLLDPVAMASSLPWRRSDGSIASRDEIVADFDRVKNFPNAARLGHKSVEHVAQLRLNPEDMDAAVLAKVRNNETILRVLFPEYDDWCADAQLGVMSMAWACGPALNRGWPKLTKALREKDYLTAAVECFMPEEATIGGLRPRNRANRILFRNAAWALGSHVDPDVLFFPKDMLADDEETQPNLVPAVRTPPLESVTVNDFPIIHPPVPFGDDPDDAA